MTKQEKEAWREDAGKRLAAKIYELGKEVDDLVRELVDGTRRPEQVIRIAGELQYLAGQQGALVQAYQEVTGKSWYER